MNNLKRQAASLPEAALASVQSSQFASKLLANASPEGVAALQAVAHAVQPEAGTIFGAENPPPVLSLGDTLVRCRAMSGGKMPFEERAKFADIILNSLRQHLNDVATEIYAQCVLELARAFLRRELPMNRRLPVAQFMIERLNPHAKQLLPAPSRRIVRVVSCMTNQNLVPGEAANAMVAVVLHQMQSEHWSMKERAICLELILHGMNYYGYSELLRSSVIARVFRLASDRTRPLAPEEYVRLAGAVAACLWKFRVPTNQIRDAIQMSLTAIRSKKGTPEERSMLALAIAFYMNEDFSFGAPIEDLREAANLPGVNPDIANGILYNIKRQPESYYRSLGR